MAFTQSELYTLAKSAGLTDSRAKVAAAIAMAESKGDPNAHNTDASTGDDSYGLWQINMLGGMGPERRKLLGLTTNDQLFNPQTNAKAMAKLSSNGGNFNPWSTYTNQTYQQYMGNNVTDESSKPGWLERIGKAVSPIANIPNPGDAVSDIAGVIGVIGKGAVWGSNPRNWVRVGYVVGGTVICVIGVYMVIASTQAGRTATKAAKTIVTKGKASK